MPKITIRAYRKADWPQVAAIHDAARKQELHYAHLDDAFLPLAQVAPKVAFFKTALTVAVIDQQVVGYAGANDHELVWLYVDPKFQRQGVGSALLRQALSVHPRLEDIEVLNENPAKLLYAKFGFEPLVTLSGPIPGNEQYGVLVERMRRPLPSAKLQQTS